MLLQETERDASLVTKGQMLQAALVSVLITLREKREGCDAFSVLRVASQIKCIWNNNSLNPHITNLSFSGAAEKKPGPLNI